MFDCNHTTNTCDQSWNDTERYEEKLPIDSKKKQKVIKQNNNDTILLNMF